jgi:hypothetical protein
MIKLKKNYIPLLIFFATLSINLFSCNYLRNGLAQNIVMQKSPMNPKTAILESMYVPEPKEVQLTKKKMQSLQEISIQDKNRIMDCHPDRFVTDPVDISFAFPYFNYFQKSERYQFKHFLTEQNKWPFLVSYANIDSYKPGEPVFIGMRGDAAGFHKTDATSALFHFGNYFNSSLYLFIDEYRYLGKTGDISKSIVVPLCHKRHYPDGYVGPDIPAFQNGGNWKLLNKLTPSQNFIFVSYSNGSIPRNKFLERENAVGYSPNFNHISNPSKFLDEYIANTNLSSDRSHDIRGLIDFEGNYLMGKPVWDLLAFIKENIEPNPNKFYYAVERIAKDDGYPVHVLMVNALGLHGVEDKNGVVIYKNKRKNVMIEIITNPTQPFYSGKDLDLRKSTNMSTYDGKIERLGELNHFNVSTWASKRLTAKYKNFIKTGSPEFPVIVSNE